MAIPQSKRLLQPHAYSMGLRRNVLHSSLMLIFHPNGWHNWLASCFTSLCSFPKETISVVESNLFSSLRNSCSSSEKELSFPPSYQVRKVSEDLLKTQRRMAHVLLEFVVKIYGIARVLLEFVVKIYGIVFRTDYLTGFVEFIIERQGDFARQLTSRGFRCCIIGKTLRKNCLTVAF